MSLNHCVLIYCAFESDRRDSSHEEDILFAFSFSPSFSLFVVHACIHLLLQAGSCAACFRAGGRLAGWTGKKRAACVCVGDGVKEGGWGPKQVSASIYPVLRWEQSMSVQLSSPAIKHQLITHVTNLHRFWQFKSHLLSVQSFFFKRVNNI